MAATGTPWFKSFLSAYNDPKTFELADRLGVWHATAHGIYSGLCGLAALTGGLLSARSLRTLEAQLRWQGERGVLVRALLEAGILDPPDTQGACELHNFLARQGAHAQAKRQDGATIKRPTAKQRGDNRRMRNAERSRRRRDALAEQGLTTRGTPRQRALQADPESLCVRKVRTHKSTRSAHAERDAQAEERVIPDEMAQEIENSYASRSCEYAQTRVEKKDLEHAQQKSSSSVAQPPREIPGEGEAEPLEAQAQPGEALAAADEDCSAAPGQENPTLDPELQELLARAAARATAADARQAAEDAAQQAQEPEPEVAPAPEPARPAQPSTERRPALASHVRNDPYAHMPVVGAPPSYASRSAHAVCDADAARDWAQSVGLSTRINRRSLLEEFAAAQVTWGELLAAWKHVQGTGVPVRSVGYVMATAMSMRSEQQARSKAAVQVPGEWQRELEEIAWEHMGLPGVPLPMAREIHRHHESMQQVRRLAGECATLKQLVARLRKPGAAHRCAADSTPQQAGEVAAGIAAGGEG